MSNRNSKTISSISPTTDSGFIPHNVPPGSIRGDRINSLPDNFEVYAIHPNDKSRVRRVTANLNPYSHIVSIREGHKGDWHGSILDQPVKQLTDKDWYFYDPKDNAKVEKFIESQKLEQPIIETPQRQSTAKGKMTKKRKSIKRKSIKRKSIKRKSKKYHRIIT